MNHGPLLSLILFLVGWLNANETSVNKVHTYYIYIHKIYVCNGMELNVMQCNAMFCYVVYVYIYILYIHTNYRWLIHRLQMRIYYSQTSFPWYFTQSHSYITTVDPIKQNMTNISLYQVQMKTYFIRIDSPCCFFNHQRSRTVMPEAGPQNDQIKDKARVPKRGIFILGARGSHGFNTYQH